EVAAGPRCDSNMRSAWIWRRNDVLGNLAVMLVALGVFGTGTGWPDIAGAFIMTSLARGAWVVLGQSWTEMRASASLQPANRRLAQEARLRNTKCKMPPFLK